MAIASLRRRDTEAATRARPHICFVAPHAWPVFSGDPRIEEVGGAEVQQSRLARLFASRGYRVSMICIDYGQPDRTVIDGVTVHKAFRLDEGLPVLRFLHPRLTAIWRALGNADADIYYCRASGMLVGVVARFCRRHGKRSIYAAASDRDFDADQRGRIRYARDRWLYRRGVAAVDAIVAQNEAQLASCRATYGREAMVIPSFYPDPPSTESNLSKERQVLWVGTIRAGKRPDLFLDLAQCLPQRRFVMVGGPSRTDAPLYERVRSRAASLPNVRFTGFLPLADADRQFDSARVHVNTAEYEGMPNTFLQAWARGVPTLGTSDVGVPVHRRFARVQEAAAEIEALFSDELRWQKLSRACREHYERTHSGAQTVARYERLFEGLGA
jgi:glycosyltransferase involved in cell wall biosynthesis